MADAGGVVAGELQRVVFVIVPGAQIGALALDSRQLQPVDPGEEVEALVEPVGIDFDVAEMGDVAHSNSSTVRGKIASKPSAYFAGLPPAIPPELRR